MTKSGRLRGPKGRFVPFQRPAVEEQGATETRRPGAATGKALQPTECAGYLRKELANSFPAIVQGFVKQAESGSAQHLKLTTELLEKAAAPGRQKGSAQRLLEKLRRMDRAESATAEAPPADAGWRE